MQCQPHPPDLAQRRRSFFFAFKFVEQILSVVPVRLLGFFYAWITLSYLGLFPRSGASTPGRVFDRLPYQLVTRLVRAYTPSVDNLFSQLHLAKLSPIIVEFEEPSYLRSKKSFIW